MLSRRNHKLVFSLLALVLAGMWLVSPASATDGSGRHRPATRFHGDQAVHLGLVMATADVTHRRVADIYKQIAAGKSIQDIANTAGATSTQILTRFDAGVDKIIGRQVTRGKLPRSVADAMAAWYKQSARLQVNQPGFTPAFPGLHELHTAMISAAVQVSAIPRGDLRAGLENCKSLTDLVAPKGKSGTDIVKRVIQQVDIQMQAAVDNGKLSPTQRDTWHKAIQTTATTLVTTPGLHVAGIECAR